MFSFFFFNSFVNFKKKCSFFGHIVEQLATLLWWCLEISYLCMCHVYDLIIPRVHRCLTAARSFQDSAVIIKSLVYTKLYYRRVKLSCCDPISIAAKEILCFGSLKKLAVCFKEPKKIQLGHKTNSSVSGENTGWFQPPCTKLVFFSM